MPTEDLDSGVQVPQPESSSCRPGSHAEQSGSYERRCGHHRARVRPRCASRESADILGSSNNAGASGSTTSHHSPVTTPKVARAIPHSTATRHTSTRRREGTSPYSGRFMRSQSVGFGSSATAQGWRGLPYVPSTWDTVQAARCYLDAARRRRVTNARSPPMVNANIGKQPAAPQPSLRQPRACASGPRLRRSSSSASASKPASRQVRRIQRNIRATRSECPVRTLLTSVIEEHRTSPARSGS